MINGTYMSAWTEKAVPLDFDPEDYEKALDEKIRQEEG